VTETTLDSSLAKHENCFTFSSEHYDEELALFYYNYRHYNPELGSWLSRDPIEEEGGLNLYKMVDNSPINLVDLLGERGWPTFFACYIGVSENFVKAFRKGDYSIPSRANRRVFTRQIIKQNKHTMKRMTRKQRQRFY